MRIRTAVLTLALLGASTGAALAASAAIEVGVDVRHMGGPTADMGISQTELKTLLARHLAANGFVIANHYGREAKNDLQANLVVHLVSDPTGLAVASFTISAGSKARTIIGEGTAAFAITSGMYFERGSDRNVRRRLYRDVATFARRLKAPQ
ncbi:MAG: hypothetical protein RJQ08_11455 [Salinisphaeraceae bacterium]